MMFGKPARLGVLVIALVVVTALTIMLEVIKRNGEPPPLEYTTQTITNVLKKGNNDFARDVIAWGLRLKKQGYRVIHLIIDDDDKGVMLRVHIYYLEQKKEQNDNG